MAGEFRFSFGPWNIHTGPDPFGPEVRAPMPWDTKLGLLYKKLGFDAVQFHDDDAVPGLNELSAKQIQDSARNVSKRLKDKGLVAEFTAQRLTGHHNTMGVFRKGDGENEAI